MVNIQKGHMRKLHKEYLNTKKATTRKDASLLEGCIKDYVRALDPIKETHVGDDQDENKPTKKKIKVADIFETKSSAFISLSRDEANKIDSRARSLVPCSTSYRPRYEFIQNSVPRPHAFKPENTAPLLNDASTRLSVCGRFLNKLQTTLASPKKKAAS